MDVLFGIPSALNQMWNGVVSFVAGTKRPRETEEIVTASNSPSPADSFDLDREERGESPVETVERRVVSDTAAAPPKKRARTTMNPGERTARFVGVGGIWDTGKTSDFAQNVPVTIRHLGNGSEERPKFHLGVLGMPRGLDRVHRSLATLRGTSFSQSTRRNFVVRREENLKYFEEEEEEKEEENRRKKEKKEEVDDLEAAVREARSMLEDIEESVMVGGKHSSGFNVREALGEDEYFGGGGKDFGGRDFDGVEAEKSGKLFEEEEEEEDGEEEEEGDSFWRGRRRRRKRGDFFGSGVKFGLEDSPFKLDGSPFTMARRAHSKARDMGMPVVVAAAQAGDAARRAGGQVEDIVRAEAMHLSPMLRPMQHPILDEEDETGGNSVRAALEAYGGVQPPREPGMAVPALDTRPEDDRAALVVVRSWCPDHPNPSSLAKLWAILRYPVRDPMGLVGVLDVTASSTKNLGGNPLSAALTMECAVSDALGADEYEAFLWATDPNLPPSEIVGSLPPLLRNIPRSSTARLVDGQWLNDDCILAISLLTNLRSDAYQRNEIPPPTSFDPDIAARGKAPLTWTMNPAFYGALTGFSSGKGYNYESVRRWTERGFSARVWTRDMVLVPLNPAGHWSLVLLDLHHQRVRSINSIPGYASGSVSEAMVQLPRWLDDEMADKGETPLDAMSWPSQEYGADWIATQENGCDCGVLVARAIETIGRGIRPAHDAQTENVPFLRRWIALTILRTKYKF